MPFMTIHGISSYYEIAGEGDPVLFIHGLGSSTRDWEDQVAEFRKNYQVITTDLRGHGRTGKPKGPYSISMFADDVAELIQKRCDKPVHVIGLSMGAATAFHLSIDYPGMVRTAVITNMSAAMPVQTFAQKKMYYARVLTVKLFGMRKMGRVIASNVFKKPDQKALRTLLEDRWAENEKKPYLASLAALKNWTVMDRLSLINCPVLVVHSENDYSPLGHKKDYTQRIPKGKLVEIPDTGHIVNMEKPDVYNRIVRDFLAAH
ncbi:MAG: alpha/beta hydrolase [Proteobacteria bacterium]|nr:alpha/beta hydrolase [Pseudomonadota bacterium]